MIYFIQGEGGGPIKIGRAKDVDQRLRDLQCGSPVRLRLLRIRVGEAETERRLHKRLAAHRLHGEWFVDCPEVRQYVDGDRSWPEWVDDGCTKCFGETASVASARRVLSADEAFTQLGYRCSECGHEWGCWWANWWIEQAEFREERTICFSESGAHDRAKRLEQYFANG